MEKESVFIAIILFIVCFISFLFTVFVCGKKGKKSVLIFLLLSILVPYPLADFMYWGTGLMTVVTALIISIPPAIWALIIVAQALGMHAAGSPEKEIDKKITSSMAPLLIWGSLIFFTIFLFFLLQKFPEYSFLSSL